MATRGISPIANSGLGLLVLSPAATVSASSATAVTSVAAVTPVAALSPSPAPTAKPSASRGRRAASGAPRRTNPDLATDTYTTSAEGESDSRAPQPRSATEYLAAASRSSRATPRGSSLPDEEVDPGGIIDALA